MKLIIIFLLVLIIFSCSDSPVSIIEPSDGYYFVGYVFDAEKRFIHGENDYRVSTDVGSDCNCNYYVMSIYKFPLERYNIGDEWLSISTPDVTHLDSLGLIALFNPRRLLMPTSPDSLYEGFSVSFFRVKSKHFDSSKNTWIIDKTAYHSYCGEQNGSSLEIISSRVLDEGTDYPVMEVKYSINCRLYDVNGKFAGTIRQGIFKGKIHLWKFFD